MTPKRVRRAKAAAASGCIPRRYHFAAVALATIPALVVGAKPPKPSITENPEVRAWTPPADLHRDPLPEVEFRSTSDRGGTMHDRILEKTAAPGPFRQFLEKSKGNPLFDEERLDTEFRARFQAMKAQIRTHLAARRMAAAENERPTGVTAGLPGTRKMLVLSTNGNDGQLGLFEAETGEFIRTVAPLASGLAGPTDLAMGADGHVYIANGMRHNILRYDGQTLEKHPGPLGAEGTAEFVPAGSAGLFEPRGIAFGSDGNLYVSVPQLDAVYRFAGPTPSGDCAGLTPGAPCPGPLAAEGTAEFVPAGGGGLVGGWHLTVGPDGDLYVIHADAKILRFDGSTGEFIDVFASVCEGPAPTEDNCESALELTHHGGDPEHEIVRDFDLRCATPSGVPAEELFHRDVWYRYRAPCDGSLTVDTCELRGFGDNILAIHDGGATGPCPTDISTRLNAFVDADLCSNAYGPERQELQVVEGGWYLLRIGAPQYKHGTGTLRVSITCEGAVTDRAQAESTPDLAAEDECDLVLMNDPMNVRFGPDGHLYVASGSNNRILRFDGATGALIDQVICPGLGTWDINTMAFGPDGRLYVGDWLGLVWRYDLGAGPLGELFINTNELPFPYIAWGLLVLPLCGDGVCEVGEHSCNCLADCPPPLGFDDCNANGLPDECEPDTDCNANGVRDICDIGAGTSDDCNDNLIPDECESDEDCNGNGIQDICDLVGPVGDCNGNGTPDDCEDDCNANSVPDDCDIASGSSGDCNANTIPDDCDIASGTSPDGDGGGVPDECESSVLYVDSDAAGGNNGTNWADAYTDLQDALATAYGAAGAVTEIRVAAGTYKPDNGTGDRTRRFAMQSGLQILGGFAGNAAEDPNERDVARFETVLSGDLAGNDILVEPGAGGGEPDDSCANAGPIYTGETRFDTTYATTDGPNPVDCEYGPQPLGADIWYVYTHTCPTTHVRISVCETEAAPFFFDPFIAVYEGNTCPPAEHLACNDDYCAWGSDLEFEAEPGGKYLLRVGGWNGAAGRGVINVRCVQYADVPDEYAPTYASLVNMQENSHQVLVAEEVDATAVIDGFTITGGMANGESQVFGGGMAIIDARPTVRNCRFVRNTAALVGGGMWQSGFGAEFGTGPTFIDCAFVGNTAWAIAAANGDRSAMFYNCVFAQNETLWGFAALAGLFSNCTFRENTNTTEMGAGCIGGPAVIEHCLFERNVANRGGAMFNQFPDMTFEVRDSLFVNNRAYFQGGAIRHDPDLVGLTIRNSVFLNNRANYYGGAIYNLFEDARMDVTNSIFAGNTSVVAGGAISQNFAGVTTLDHVTLKDNSALYQDADFGSGGGIHTFGGTVNVSNSILWGNSDELGTGLSSQIGSKYADVEIKHSCVQGLEAGPDAEGNIGRNPLLTPDGHLCAGSPCIDAGNPGYVPDPAGPLDIDGDLRVLGSGTDMGADEFSDLDLDRLPDWWELKHFHSTVAAVAGEDSDDDGLTNFDEYERYGTNPIAKPYYVSGTAGRNANDGLSADPAGHGVGPKRTIQAALDVAGDGDTVVVVGQHQPYDGLGNFELDFDGKSIVVRSADGATIDCAGGGRAVNHFSLGAASATLEGFNLYDCTGDVGGAIRQAQSRLQMRDCVLESCEAQFAAGGIFLTRSSPTFSYLSLGSNWAPFVDAGIIENASVGLEGPFEIERGMLEVSSSWFDGPGHIELMPDALLHITGLEGNGPTVLRSNLTGTGAVLIDPGRELRVEGGSVVDLSGGTGTGSCADPTQAELWGTIYVEGSLFVRDATVQNTNVEVKIADFEDNTDIINNDITLLDASAGFGGQFFVDGRAVVQCNTIVSEGDRYLDLDPDPNAPIRPLIEGNRFFVVITQGVEGEQGEIFDLRIQDFDCAGDCPSGAHQASSSAGYDDEWALEELNLLPATKLNLTNRQGMVFQDPAIPTPETLYVKDLILGSGATLNTAFERLYYQHLTDEFGVELVRDPENPTAPLANGSRIVDIPLLGFSLGVIAMNDDTEFSVRVRTRTTDSDDYNPDDPFAPLPQGRVRRIAGLDPNPDDGYLELETGEASSVSAKGAFARATEDSIIVSFQYLFRDNPAAELVVYLSDVAEPNASGCRPEDRPCSDDHRHEIARVYPPAAGRRGAIGSEEFATFHGSFPRGDLNFIRGTYVELELRNAGSLVWIDEWDPLICSTQCGAFSGEDFVTDSDYLYLLSEYGKAVRGTDKECGDSLLTGDGYIGISDLLAWELYYADSGELFNLCGNGLPGGRTASVAVPALVPPERIVIAGKQAGGQEDRLYTLNPNGACTGEVLIPASTPSSNGYRANGRLARDASGRLYQLHSAQGLIRLADAHVVIPPPGHPVLFDGKQIIVGTWPVVHGNDKEPRGVPMQDIAFHLSDDSIVYVAPVLVEPPEGEAYKAAARLRLTGGPEHFVIEQLYGAQPIHGDGCCNVYPCSASECSVNHTREIEVAGGKLFVTSSRINGDDWLLVFDEITGAEQAQIPLAIPSPTALTLTQTGQIYLASSMEGEDPTGTELYRYTLDESGDDPVLVLDSVIRIDHMRQITAVAENPEDGSLWVAGFDAPTFDDSYVFLDDDPLFTTPMLAMVSDGAMTVAATEITCHDLALPLSMVFNAACAASGDAEPDGDIDLRDFAAFQQCMTGSGGDHGGSPCIVLDSDCDGDVDQLDYKFIGDRLTGPT